MSEDLSATECQSRVEQFTQVTLTDEALAQFYLQDHNWDVDSSITAYLEQNRGEKEKEGPPNKRPKLNVSDSLKNFIKEQIDPIKKEFPDKISFITWNIDGLDEKNIVQRTLEVVKTIQKRKVDIVFFQEIVPQTYDILKSNLSSEYVLTQKKVAYFTVVLLKRSTINLESVVVKPFENSSMCRDLTIVNAALQNGTKFVLINTHLESTKDFAEARMKQLKEAFKTVKEENRNVTVILAGDMNARDTEVKKVGIPDGIEDLWISMGERKECQYTWDTLRNTNLHINGKFKPRCRFDRVYFRSSEMKEISAEHFGLCGIEKVQGAQCFPSDHWGIYCVFNISKDSKDN